MRAVVCDEEVGPSSLSVEELDPSWNDVSGVLIDVEAAGVSYVDLLMTYGRYQMRPPLPFIPGIEICGVVAEAPAGVDLARGDRVAAYVETGGYAERAVAKVGAVTKLPDGANAALGVSFAVNYQTAYLALAVRAVPPAGGHIVVSGATGGVGSACIQVARGLGCIPHALIRDEADREWVHGVGAESSHLIGDDWCQTIKEATNGGAHAFVDLVGSDMPLNGLRCLRPSGKYIVLGFAGGKIPTVQLNRPLLRNLDIVGVAWGAYIQHDRSVVQKGADALAKMYADGVVRAPESRRYPLERAAEALFDLEQRRFRGKALLTT